MTKKQHVILNFYQLETLEFAVYIHMYILTEIITAMHGKKIKKKNMYNNVFISNGK